MEKNIKIAGVSIIEILIAMFLVAIALFTIATLFPQMGAHRKGIHESEQAKIIAMEVLEGLQMFSTIAADASNGGSVYDICPDPGSFPSDISQLWADFRDKWYDASETIGAATYETSWTILPSNCVTTTAEPFKTAKVTVKWDKSGKPHKIEVTGVIR